MLVDVYWASNWRRAFKIGQVVGRQHVALPNVEPVSWVFITRRRRLLRIIVVVEQLVEKIIIITIIIL